MSAVDSRSDLPPTSELLENLSFFPIALVVSATIFPGLTLCIPGLILAAALILIPLVAIAIVVLLAAAVVAAPVFAVRGIRGLARRHAASKSRAHVAIGEAAPTSFVPPRFAAAAVQRLTAGAPLHPPQHQTSTVRR